MSAPPARKIARANTSSETSLVPRPVGAVGCLLLGCLLVATVPGSATFAYPAPDAEARFREGLEHFEAAREERRNRPADREGISRRFLEAARAFVRAAEEGATTTEVFTNAANSYYFAGRTGEAVIYYRRALAIDPANEAARGALEHIRARLPIRREASGAASLAESLFFWHDESFLLLRLWGFYLLFPSAWILFAVEATRGRWSWTRALLIPVLPFALVALVLSYLFGLRRPYAIAGALCLIPALAFAGSLAVEAVEDDFSGQAVVLVAVEGRKGDGEIYSESALLHPGTEVEIIEERGREDEGRWAHVRLPDGSTSWVPSETLERIVTVP